MRIDGHLHLDNLLENENLQLTKLYSEYKKIKINRALLIPKDDSQKNSLVSSFCERNLMFHFVSLIDFDNLGFQSLEDQMRYHSEVYNCVGYKIHPRYQGIKLTDKRILMAVQLAGELRKPVIIDCMSSRSIIPIKCTLPLLIDEIAHECPKTTIIIAHMGGHRVLDAFAVARNNPNVFLDISAVMIKFFDSSVINDVGFVVFQLAKEGKIVFGSDYPIFSPYETFKLLEKIMKKWHIKQRYLEFIMGRNIERIFENNF